MILYFAIISNYFLSTQTINDRKIITTRTTTTVNYDKKTTHLRAFNDHCKASVDYCHVNLIQVIKFGFKKLI